MQQAVTNLVILDVGKTGGNEADNEGETGQGYRTHAKELGFGIFR